MEVVLTNDLWKFLMMKMFQQKQFLLWDRLESVLHDCKMCMCACMCVCTETKRKHSSLPRPNPFLLLFKLICIVFNLASCFAEINTYHLFNAAMSILYKTKV